MLRAIYADFNATTPLGEESVRWMNRAFEAWGNPSSAHKPGRDARALLDEARATVARAAHCEPAELVFTSGGSEANTLALMGAGLAHGEGFRLLTSAVEHSSVKDTAALLESRGATVEKARVRPNGELDLDAFESALDQFEPHLVSLMAANNETGVLFPIPDVAALCAERGVPFHTDAVQALGKVPPSFFAGPDLVSISAHKLYGPKGAGALIVRRGRKLVPTHYGGSQETKRRGGTENLVGAAGFAGACAELPPDGFHGRLRELRDRFETRLRAAVPDALVNGEKAPRLPNTTSVRLPGIASDAMLGALDLDGMYVSAGSACSSGSIMPSHVLVALGLSAEEARECLRVSWGRSTTTEDVDEAVDRIKQHVDRIKARRG